MSAQTPRRPQRRLRVGRRSRKTSPDSLLADKPFRRLQNPWPPLAVLDREQLAQIDDASMTILESVGLDFLEPEALDYWITAGAKVDRKAQHVWLDRGLIRELVRRAPDSFKLRAPNPAHDLVIGGNHINFATVGAVPLYQDLDVGRRPGRMADFKKMVKLAQVCHPIHVVEGLLVEPQDVPVAYRNLEKGLAVLTLSDKAMTTAAHGRVAALDYIKMVALVYGGLEEIAHTPVLASNVNVNSPLRMDTQMLEALIVYARYGQPCVITPFILAGAMSPVTMAAAIAQQNAEALAGIALTQLVNPGVPVVYGGFTTNIDMQSGAPAFGTPEAALALLAGAQLARYYGLPYRGSGGLNNAKVADAQASYETQMSLWPAVLGHSNLILHSAGWLDSGLVCSLEKFIIDVEGLAIMHRFLAGIEVNAENLALDEIAQVGPGGHHLGTAHTMTHFRGAFFRPMLADRLNYETWREAGSWDAAKRANQLAQKLLREYEEPPLDTAVREALHDYVAGRRAGKT